MKLIKLNLKEHRQLFSNMLVAYESEFSYITLKEPSSTGEFSLDFDLNANDIKIYLLFLKSKPAGLTILKISETVNEVCEFYIYPCFRRNGNGKKFASLVFDKHKGDWQVKQLAAAKEAYQFWFKVISGYTRGNFSDGIENDNYWGKVNCQRFTSG